MYNVQLAQGEDKEKVMPIPQTFPMRAHARALRGGDARRPHPVTMATIRRAERWHVRCDEATHEHRAPSRLSFRPRVNLH
jgi:hypothetical protein